MILRRPTLVLVVAAVAASAAGAAVGPHGDRPRVTNRCPVNALPLRTADLPALRRFGIGLAPDGVQQAGPQAIAYRDARARAAFPSFYTGFVRSACPARVAARVRRRTADVFVRYPHVKFSSSLSYSVFLVARTPGGLVGWAQMH